MSFQLTEGCLRAGLCSPYRFSGESHRRSRIVWYTVETFGLRRETVRQNGIAVRPLVVTNIEYRQISVFPAPIVGTQVVMKNIGKGLALFVQIDDTTLVELATGWPLACASRGCLLLRRGKST